MKYKAPLDGYYQVSSNMYTANPTGEFEEDDWRSGVELTYCKIHDGLWPHECGCYENGLQDEEEE